MLSSCVKFSFTVAEVWLITPSDPIWPHMNSCAAQTMSHAYVTSFTTTIYWNSICIEPRAARWAVRGDDSPLCRQLNPYRPIVCSAVVVSGASKDSPCTCLIIGRGMVPYGNVVQCDTYPFSCAVHNTVCITLGNCMSLNHSVLIRQVAACGRSTKRINLDIYKCQCQSTNMALQCNATTTAPAFTGPLFIHGNSDSVTYCAPSFT